MLEDLQTQVIEEGKAEATTYDKFACFCKDMTDEKTDAITTGQTSVDDLTATMNSKTAYRAELDTEIEELDTALKVLKMGQEMGMGAFAQTEQSVFKTVRKAALMADAISPKTSAKRQRVIADLLQKGGGGGDGADVGQVNYEDHSGGVVEVVEEMEGTFVEEEADLKHEEQVAQQEHDKLVLSLELQIGSAEKDLEKTEETRATTTKEIASTQGDLTTTLAQLHDDQSYLKDLTAKCEDKSKEWDQRSSMRQDELSAITEALSIIKGTVSAKTTEKTVRLVQKASVVAKTDAEDSEEDEDEDVSFLQADSARHTLSSLAKTVKGSKGFMKATTPRDRLVELLKTKSKELKSSVLSTLATKVAADPFAKIKKLVQELIERLLQEAADEANHK